jgi:hypothetical protein
VCVCVCVCVGRVRGGDKTYFIVLLREKVAFTVSLVLFNATRIYFKYVHLRLVVFGGVCIFHRNVDKLPDNLAPKSQNTVTFTNNR